MLPHFQRVRVKKIVKSCQFLQHTEKKAKISKKSVYSLMLLQYNLFLHKLIKEANTEARSKKSKMTRQEHVKAVAKRVLRKYRR